MHLIVTDVVWETEGQTLEECQLPSTVLVLDAPRHDEDYIRNNVSEALSDSFGFSHDGFNWSIYDESLHTYEGGGWLPARLAVMPAPRHPLEENSSAVRVIRKHLATNYESVHAGYDEITVFTAVQFLNHWADEEARESRLTVRPNDYLKDGKKHWERILSEPDGRDVVVYYLKFRS